MCSVGGEVNNLLRSGREWAHYEAGVAAAAAQCLIMHLEKWIILMQNSDESNAADTDKIPGILP